MCRNCAYSKNGKPGESEECQVCSRNPSLLSRKFTPRMFKGRRIERPIDFYISKEHYKLLKEVLEEEIRKVLSKKPKSSPILTDNPWDYWTWKFSTTTQTILDSDTNSYQRAYYGWSVPSSLNPNTITIYTALPPDILEKYDLPTKQVSFKVTPEHLNLEGIKKKGVRTCSLKKLMEELDGLEV